VTAMLPSRPPGEDHATRAGEVVDPDTVLTRPAVGEAPRIISTLRLPRRRRGREIVAVLDPVRARPLAGEHPGEHQRSDQQVVEAAAERLTALLRQRSLRVSAALVIILFGLWTLPGPHQQWLMQHLSLPSQAHHGHE